MKKRFLAVLLSILLLSALIPLHASACGGFVAIRGETIFHSVYCSEIMGAEYDSLIWFNRAADAEVWGYTMCEECSDYHDYDFHSDICDYYFETDDPLLITTMELSLECGYEAGCESGRESMHEEVNWAYEDGYEDGRDRGRSEGREEAESEYEYRREEIRENRKGLVFTIAGLIGIAYVISWLDNRKKK